MSYYIRQRNLFDSNSKEAFKLSRSKLDLFISCPRCFYLDRKLGISRPSGPSFSLNSAVDTLLKKEFDIYRAKEQNHPLLAKYDIDARPFQHENMGDWRNNFKGIRFPHKETNFLLFGAIDDIWIDNKTNELFIVDYKSTSTAQEITLDGKWKKVYKRQMEIYQWLARHNDVLKNYKISNIGYFVYCNGRKDNEAFNNVLEFNIMIIPYESDDSWVEPSVKKAYQCLTSDNIPEANPDCEHCSYVKTAHLD